MPWYAWVIVAYIVLDRLITVAVAGKGRKIEITSSFAVSSLISGAVIIWGIVSLATV